MLPTWIKSIFVKLLYEFPLIFLVVLIFQDKDTSFFGSIGYTFLFVFLLWFFELLILVKDSIIQILNYKFSSKTEKSIDEIVNYLIKIDFPKPDDDEDFEFIESIFENVDTTQNSMECVIYTTQVFSLLQYMMNSGKFLSFYLYSKTLEHSLIRYRQICNSRN